MARYTKSQAFKDLGKIDKSHDAGRITKRQHDVRSKRVLSKLVNHGRKK